MHRLEVCICVCDAYVHSTTSIDKATSLFSEVSLPSPERVSLHYPSKNAKLVYTFYQRQLKKSIRFVFQDDLRCTRKGVRVYRDTDES